MASPAWLVAAAAEGARGGWARVPLPLAPRLAPGGEGAPVDEAGTAAERHPPLPLCGDGVCQAAFSARTPAGGRVLLFFTGVLAPAAAPAPAPAPPGGAGARPLPRPQSCVWQVSLQLRFDDARVRAALVADFGELITTLFAGRLQLVSHGNAPSPHSMLQHLDMVSPPSEAPPLTGDGCGGGGGGGAAALLEGAAAAALDASSGGGGVCGPAFSALLAPPTFFALEALIKEAEDAAAAAEGAAGDA